MTERMASGWMTVWRLDTGSQRFERRSQDGGSNGTTWGDIIKESEEMQIEALERGLRGAKGNVATREYHFRSGPRDDNAPSAL